MLLMSLEIFLGWSGMSLLLALAMGRIMGIRPSQCRAVYYLRANTAAFHLAG
jgi:hypothetical protein